MTENNCPERIQISGTTGRNLIHKPSIGFLQGGSWIRLHQPWSLGAKGTECAAERTFRCLKICIGVFEVGHFT